MANINPLQGPFERINNALETYYNRLGRNYRDVTNNNNGVFLQYCMDEELIDNDLEIEDELGDESDPTDCAYTWLSNKHQFPVPSHITISPKRMEEFIFYILQYCYKYNQPPSNYCMSQNFVKTNVISTNM